MFGNKLNPTPATPAAPTPGAAPSRSKYGGIACADTRDPMLGIGTYRVRVVSCTEGYNPGKRRESYKVGVQVVEAAPDAQTPVGAAATIVHFMTPAGLGELKRWAMHAAGFGPTLDDYADATAAKTKLRDGEAAFDELDARCGYSGAVLEKAAGKANNAPSLIGRLVDVIVSRGKDVPNPQSGAPTGDFFRVYTWGVVDESEQPAQ